MSATPTYIWGIPGQSNALGKGASTYGNVYHSWRMRPNGYWRQLGPGNHPLSDNDGEFSGGRENTTYSWEGSLGDALRPIPGVHVIVPCGVNGTTATQWATDLTTSPIELASTVAHAEECKARTQHALEIPNAVLGGFLIYQGESNIENVDTIANWTAGWQAFCNEMNSFFVGRFASPKHFGIVQMQPTFPTDFAGSNATHWANLRTAQANFVAANADSVLIPRPDYGASHVSGENYHPTDMPDVGAAIGAAIVANWGL